MANLRSNLIKLAHTNPELRPHLLPILTRAASGKERMSGLDFSVLDMQGKSGFPEGPEGFVYSYALRTEIMVKGYKKPWRADFVIRTDKTNKGWRIDKLDMGIPEKVDEMPGYYRSPDLAAKDLAAYINDVESGSIPVFF